MNRRRRISAVDRRPGGRAAPVRRGRVAAVVGALLVGILSTASSAAQSSATELEVERLDGRRIRGALLSVTPNLLLVTPDGEHEAAWADLLAVRCLLRSATRPAVAPPAQPGPLAFALADDSRFSGTLGSASGEELTVTLSDGQTCRLHLDMLRSIAVRDAEPAARARFEELLRNADHTADAAVVARGGEALTLRGSVKRIDAQGVLFNWNDRDVPLPWSSVVGVVIARPTARRASQLVFARDGDAFAGRVAEGSPDEIVLQSAAFDRLVLPWSRVERIECRSQKLVFLSELTPARYDFEPFFDKQWPFALDRTLSGRSIHLGNREYPRGVTLHSKSTLLFRLAGEFRLFAATVGICDELGPRGAATVRVLGDDRVLWEARVRGGEPPEDVLVPVSNVAELALQVDYDEALDLGDHACWAFARLIK